MHRNAAGQLEIRRLAFTGIWRCEKTFGFGQPGCNLVRPGPPANPILPIAQGADANSAVRGGGKPIASRPKRRLIWLALLRGCACNEKEDAYKATGDQGEIAHSLGCSEDCGCLTPTLSCGRINNCERSEHQKIARELQRHVRLQPDLVGSLARQ
jgi:hypothetical protein